MRSPRQTFPEAFHHATSRGIDGKKIFAGDDDKKYFLELLGKKAKLNGLRIFAYCLMDNHYHLVLENRSGRLSDFFRQLNGHYGQYYRKRTKSRGYVFQSRFYSSLVQDESYLVLAIKYVLLNPVKAGMAESALAYPWSSAGQYFTKTGADWLAAGFVEGLFGSRQGLLGALGAASDEPLPIVKTRLGPVVGGEDFIEEAQTRFDRRKTSADDRRKRIDDRFLEPVEKVIQEFEHKHKLKLKNIDLSSHNGKRLRGKLLIRLHELAGMTYAEIAELPLFLDLKFHSLGHLYKLAKRRESEKVKN
jgi:REP element-mobilizing transposase RayT